MIITQGAFLDKVVNQIAAQARAVASAKSIAQLENAVDEFTDLILYANDLARCAPQQVSEALVAKLIHGLVEGLLLTSLLEEPYCPPESERLPNTVALFLCGQFVSVSSYPSLVCQALELLGMTVGASKNSGASDRSLMRVRSLDSNDNVYRKALVNQLSYSDPRVVVSAVGVFVGVLSNPDLPKALVDFKDFTMSSASANSSHAHKHNSKSLAAAANGEQGSGGDGTHEESRSLSGANKVHSAEDEHDREKKIFGNVVDPVTEDLKGFFSSDVINALVRVCSSACRSRLDGDRACEVLSVAQQQSAWALSKIGSRVAVPISELLASFAVDICESIITGPWADYAGPILEEEAEAAIQVLQQKKQPPTVSQSLILLPAAANGPDTPAAGPKREGESAPQAEQLRAICFTYALGKGIEANATGKSLKSLKAFFAQLPRRQPCLKPGQRLGLNRDNLTAMHCKVSFERGKENSVLICHDPALGDDIYLVEPISSGDRASEDLHEEGSIKFGAAICAAKPVIDAR